MENEELQTSEEVNFEDLFDEVNDEMSSPLEANNEVDDTPVEETKVEEKESMNTVEEVKEEQTIPEFDFEITYNGTKERLTKDDAIKLAQKGKDYDRVRNAYDFVKELAEYEGMSVDEYMKATNEDVKEMRIKKIAEERDIPEDVARELYESKEKERKSLASEKELQNKKAQEEKTQKDLRDFQEAYPEVGINSISKDIWDKVATGKPLVMAYMQHEMEQLKNENQILKTNAKNKEQEIITGTKAQAEVKDIFDEAWDNA